MRLIPAFVCSLALVFHAGSAAAQSSTAGPSTVGLGVAVGAEFSATKLKNLQLQRTAGQSFSWGFFVDVPLAEVFYLTPGAMLYQLDLGDGYQPVTDIDLAFKFIAPVGPIRLGVGFVPGLSSVEKQYVGHVGALAHVALALGPSVEAFVQFQYKRLFRTEQGLDNLHGYAGAMLHF